MLALRAASRGGKLTGGETHHKTPCLDAVPPVIRFPPRFDIVHALSFCLEETGTDQTNPTF